MYKYLRNMLNLADQVGDVKEVDLGDWVKDTERIIITGTSKRGGTFRLEMRIEIQEDETND